MRHGPHKIPHGWTGMHARLGKLWVKGKLIFGISLLHLQCFNFMSTKIIPAQKTNHDNDAFDFIYLKNHTFSSVLNKVFHYLSIFFIMTLTLLHLLNCLISYILTYSLLLCSCMNVTLWEHHVWVTNTNVICSWRQTKMFSFFCWWFCRWLLFRRHCVSLVRESETHPWAWQIGAVPVHHYRLSLCHGDDEL